MRKRQAPVCAVSSSFERWLVQPLVGQMRSSEKHTNELGNESIAPELPLVIIVGNAMDPTRWRL